jgi:hypothetical protein
MGVVHQTVEDAISGGASSLRFPTSIKVVPSGPVAIGEKLFVLADIPREAACDGPDGARIKGIEQ